MKAPRSDLKSALLSAARNASLSERLPLTARTALSIKKARYNVDVYYTLGYSRSEDDSERGISSPNYDNAFALNNEFNWSNIDERHQAIHQGTDLRARFRFAIQQRVLRLGVSEPCMRAHHRRIEPCGHLASTLNKSQCRDMGSGRARCAAAGVGAPVVKGPDRPS